MKAIKKPLLLFVSVILLTFVSCEKDNNETETSKSDFNSRIVQLKDIPDIQSIVTNDLA